MSRKMRRMISLLLCIAMVLSFNLGEIGTAFAANTEDAHSVTESISSLETIGEEATGVDQTNESSGVEDTFEDVKGTELLDKREEHIKYFELENGLNEAVLYGYPVHYLEDGKYEDIDNSLSLTTNKDGEKVYKNKYNSFDVEISEKSSSMEITMGDYSMAWTVNGISKDVMGTKKDSLTKGEWQELKEGDKRHNVPNIACDVTYVDVLPEMDLQYVLVSNTLKENIIFNSKPKSNVITEEIETKDLELILNDDGSIDALDSKAKEVIFYIPATYMIDSDGNESNSIKVELTSNEEKYTITYTLDADWLKKASYPVLFDPTATVNTGTDGSYVVDNRICQNYPTNNYKTSSVMSTGYGSSSYLNYSLIKFTSLPTGFTADQIYAARLVATMTYDASASSTVEVHKINSSWTDAVTWNTKPTFDATYSSVTVSPTQFVDYTWNIKDIVKSWYSTANYGLLLKDSSTTSCYKEWATWQSTYYSGARAYIDYDATAPAAPSSVTTNPVATSTWTNDTTLTMSWSGITDSGGSGLKQIVYRIDGGSWVYPSTSYGIASGSLPITISSSGAHTITVRGIDNVNNWGSMRSVTYNLDVTAPTAPTALTTNPSASSSWTNDVTPTISWSGITDAHSGLTGGSSKAQYQVNDGTWINIPTSYGIASGTYTLPALSASGTYTIKVRGVDNLGNLGSSRSVTYKLDTVVPTPPISILMSPEATTISTDVTSPRLSWSGLADTGGSGLANAQYKIDSGSWVTINSSNGVASGSVGIDITTAGTHTVYVRGIDSAGNAGATSSTTYILDNITLNEQGGMKGHQQFISFDTQSGNGFINPSTGNVIYGCSDVSVSSPAGALTFSRTYNSQTTYTTPLGTGWDHNYNIKLVKEFTSGSLTGVTLKLGDGSVYHFAKNPNGTYTRPNGLFVELTFDATTGKYSLTYNDETVYLFNSNNQIEKITTSIGNWIQFSYNAQGKLTTIADNAGNEITITYSTVTGESGLIKTVSGGGRTYTYIYNASRKLIQVYITCDSNQVGEQYAYTNGKLATITNLNGYDYDISYDVSGKVDGITNPLSQEITIGYSTDTGQILITTVFNYVTQKYWYDSNSLILTKQQFENETPTTYTYNSDYQTDLTTNPNGTKTDIDYTASGFVDDITAYNHDNSIEQTTDYVYGTGDQDYLLAKVSESVNADENKVSEYRYNEDGTLWKTFVQNGDIEENQTTPPSGGTTYHLEGYSVPMSYGGGTVYVLPGSATYYEDYDEFGNPGAKRVKIVNGANTFEAITTYEYDSLGRLTETTNPDNSTISQTYDAYGNVETVTDGEGNVTKYYYNVLGQKIQETAAYGTSDATSTYYTYDFLGNVLTETDAKGYVTTYIYDALGRQTRTDFEDDTYSTTSYTVNTDGTQVTTSYDADGNKSISVANKKGQVTLEGIAGDVTDSHNAVTTGNTYTYGGDTLIQYTRSSYDVMGNVTWTTDNTGIETTNVYNDFGKLTSTTTGPVGCQTTTTYTYDDQGNVLTKSTPEMDIIKTYDLDGRVLTDTKSKNGSASTTTYEYDKVVSGKLRIIMTDPKGRQTIYEFDSNLRIAKEILSGKTTEYIYDDNGNMLTSTLTNTTFPSESAATTYTYDRYNRQHTVTYGTGHYVTYAYDANGNVTSETLTKGGSDVVTTYTYDDMNRMTEMERDGETIAMYGYTDGGALASIQYGDSATDYKTGYIYDEAGKTIEVKDLTNGANTLIREYYYTDGNLNYLEDVRGTDDAKQTFAYDELNRLETVKYYDTDDVTVLEEYTINYNDDTNNAKNQIETETTTTRYGGTVTVTEKAYTYDNLGRLTQDSVTVTVDGGTPAVTTTSYTYDAANNRTSMTSGSTTLYYDYNTYDQLLSIATDDDFEPADIVTSYAYDLSGNQTSKTEGDVVTSYSYDDANWLEVVTEQDGQNPAETLATFEYDAKGQRTQKTIGIAETNYFYNGLDLLYTTDDVGAIIEENVLENDGSMIRSQRSTGNYWYRQDIRGSVTNIVEADDDVVKSYTYDAYGNTDSTGAFVNSFAYTGAVIDPETGLYYMNARYYEPETGRFISEDTYRGDVEAFWHLYAYCNGDPINNTDPTGHDPFTLTIFGVTLTVGALIGIGVAIALLLDWAAFQQKCFIGRLITGLNNMYASVKRTLTYAKTQATAKHSEYKRDGRYENHHIVPKGRGAALAYDILVKRVHIGINSSPNMVRIKYAFHRFLNNGVYNSAIDRVINKAYSSGYNLSTRRSAVLIALAALGKSLRIASDSLRF